MLHHKCSYEVIPERVIPANFFVCSVLMGHNKGVLTIAFVI